MNKIFNKKEEANLNEAMKGKVFVGICMAIYYVIRTLINVYAYGGFKQFSEAFPHLIPLIYIMGFCLVYILLIFVLEYFREKSKIIDKAYFVFTFPGTLFTRFIYIPFKQHVWPYFLPIFVYVFIFGLIFMFTFLLFIFFDNNAAEHLPLIIFFIVTLYTIVIVYAINFIFKNFIPQNKFVDFKEGKNEKEKTQNHYLYQLGFYNNKKAYEIAMRYFHQDNVKVIIYTFYFIIILTSSIISLGGFFEGTSYIENMFQVLLSSLGTYICFERAINHRNLFNVSGKTIENTAVAQK